MLLIEMTACQKAIILPQDLIDSILLIVESILVITPYLLGAFIIIKAGDLE